MPTEVWRLLARLLEPTAAQHYAAITCRVASIAFLPGCFRVWLDGTLSADWETSCDRQVAVLVSESLTRAS